ncbi:serine hydrolase domain-containing protein [Pseudomonas quasicaspiana]|uniref:serine hydrolase domain-containing protein n=1 Tax=Pseudomonas quasicaspiana TaxID=2829821 RepID=UPI001E3F4A96|nr:serine hydrolase domain-containing protein [Pseudomonas quasicaspiana]
MIVDEATIKRIDDVWHGVVDEGRIVGGVLLLAQAGEVRYACARGWADREALRPITRDERFRLASLTKLITSVCILRLQEHGLLCIDDAVNRWLPDFTPKLADGSMPIITLRHLLSHTSGLAYGFELPVGNAYEQAGVSDGLDRVAFDQTENLRRLASIPLLFKPGGTWRYSIATDVLGVVIQRATGMTLPEAIEHWVTGPLGMSATGFQEGDRQTLACAYKDDACLPVLLNGIDELRLETGRASVSACRSGDPHGWPSAGAGMIGSADDYMRLLECLRLGGSPILTKAATSSLLSNAIGEVQIEGRGPGWKFGLGPMLLTDPQQARQLQGAGSWSWCGIYGCHYWVDPQAAISLVTMTNTAVAGAWGAFPDALIEAIYSQRAIKPW